MRGANETDNRTHLIGFTHALDGTVRAYIDGEPSGEPVVLAYDAPNIGWDLLGAGFSTGNRVAALLGFVVVVPSVISDEDVAKLMDFSRGWAQ